MSPHTTTDAGNTLKLVRRESGWVLTSESNHRCRELLYELEERLADNNITAEEAGRRLAGALERHPDWVQGAHLRAMTAAMTGDREMAEQYCRRIFQAGLDHIDAAPEKVSLDPSSAENRAFVQAAAQHIRHLADKGLYGEAADAALRLLETPGASEPSLRHDLGPYLVRANRANQAVHVLENMKSVDPACHYELGLMAFKQNDFTAAATHMRRGAARNPAIAEILMGMRHPEPVALWAESMLYDTTGAERYYLRWARRWAEDPAARVFLRWLYSHPATCLERAKIHTPREALFWATDGDERQRLVEAEQSAFEEIDDRLSHEIAVIRYNGVEAPDYPWRVVRTAHQRQRLTEHTTARQT